MQKETGPQSLKQFISYSLGFAHPLVGDGMDFRVILTQTYISLYCLPIYPWVWSFLGTSIFPLSDRTAGVLSLCLSCINLPVPGTLRALPVPPRCHQKGQVHRDVLSL